MKTCSVCQNQVGNRLHQAQELMFRLGGTFEYLDCAACGHLELLNPPSVMTPFYPANYYSFKDPGRLKRWLKRRRTAATFGHHSFVGTAMERLLGPSPLKDWFARAGVGPMSHILDVGCGRGVLIRELQDAGFLNTRGIDPFIAADYWYGRIHIAKSHIEDLTGQFDLIMLNHSFEHIVEPVSMLRTLAQRLAPQGTLLIRVPIVGAAWRKFGVHWIGLDAPRHLFVPSRKSMVLMGEQAGLRLAEEIHDSTDMQFWASEQYLRGIALESSASHQHAGHRSLFSKGDIARFAAEARALNDAQDGDQACFYFTL